MTGEGGARIWLRRPAASCCIILALVTLSVFILINGENSGKGPEREIGFSITLRHYGIDGREMERTAAIPLEDALSSISGLKRMVSSSENGRTRTFVRFDPRSAGAYEAVREAAQGVYETLPSSAQRPEIVSSNDSRVPAWMAAVSVTGEDAPAGQYLERIVKPALESLEGVGEVEISGTGLWEMVIALKPQEAASRGLSAAGLALSLGMNDALLPGGSLHLGGRETLVVVDGRYPDSFSLSAALIPLEGRPPVQLKDVADIYEQEREPDTLSRLNGKPAMIIAVIPGAGADLRSLSARIQKELAAFSSLPLKFEILSDRGAEEAAAYRSVVSAALQGAAAVALMAALLVSGKGLGNAGKRRRIALICALTVPLVCLVSAALLSLLGFPLDRPLLAGLAAGTGAAVDVAILSSERLGRVLSIREGRDALSRLKIPLISGSVTTIAALLPLAAMESMAVPVKAVAWAMGAVTLVSLVLALTLLPPLFLWGLDEKFLTSNLRFATRREDQSLQASHNSPCPLWFREIYLRLSFYLGIGPKPALLRMTAAMVRFCVRRPLLPLLFWLLLSVWGIGALIFAGADTGAETSGNSVYAQIEFEGGLRAEEVDRRLAAYAENLKDKKGIKNVQTASRTASGSALIVFDPAVIKAEKVREMAAGESAGGGFVYITEDSPGERIWEITVSGADDEKCRELAEAAARLCLTLPLIRETALNFKDGSAQLTLLPDQARLLETAVPFSLVGDTVRRSIHGPVVYKRIGPDGETDVRIRGLGREIPDRETFMETLIKSGVSGAERGTALSSLVIEKENREPASIRREDRRRTASLSIRTKPMDPRRVRDEVMKVLQPLELPQGYALEFDWEAVAAAEKLSKTVLLFLLAILLCYMVIAGTNESFTIPLAVLSAAPPSLAVPALFTVMSGAPVNAAVACAFVAVSGMAVNASVLITEEICRCLDSHRTACAMVLYRILRRRLPALLATTGTTIAAAAPFLFLREDHNEVVRILSQVIALGVGTSCICSVTMLPALAAKSPKFFNFFAPSLKRPA